MTTINRLKHQEFNEVMAEAIDESIRELFSQQVLETLYNVLSARYNVTRDEVPYRLDTAYKILSDVFGARGAQTIGKAIIRRLYSKLNLAFKETPGLTLTDYIDLAKKKLAQAPSVDESTTSEPVGG
jgi:hypothetical protein